MHLFGGKFCTKTDGSNDACTCQESGTFHEVRVRDQDRRSSLDSHVMIMDHSVKRKEVAIVKGSMKYELQQQELGSGREDEDEDEEDEGNDVAADDGKGKQLYPYDNNVTVELLDPSYFSIQLPVCVCDRKNFDNILWATVTVFQVRDKWRGRISS